MNDNNAPPTTVDALMAVKLANAKKKFYGYAEKCGVLEELREVTVDDIYAQLLSARLMWGFLENEDTEFLLELFLAGKTEETAEQVDKVVDAVRSMPKDDLELLWRYVKFFLKCVQQ